jgi:hypothetical protein
MPRKRPRIIYKDNYDYVANDRAMTKKAGIIVGSIIANLFLFFNVTFHTMIPTTIVICMFPIIIIVTYIIFKIKKVKEAGLKSTCIVPLCLNLFFLINYLISFNPKTETYTFQRQMQVTKNRRGGGVSRGLSTELLLQDYAYEDYYGIKTFVMEENIIPTYKITYTFKTGIFGIRVMTNLHFDTPE